jgi:hypothetical protein
MATFVNPGWRGPQEARYGATGQVVRTWAELDGAKVTPTSPTFQVFRFGQGSPDGEVLASGNGAVDGTTGEITVTLNCSDTTVFTLAEGYRCEVTFTFSGATYIKTIAFDVVRQPLLRFIPVRVDDLKALHVQVQQMLTAQSVGGLSAETYAHQFFIMPAWQRVMGDVVAAGRRPALVSPPETFHLVALHAAAEKMFAAFSRAADDIFDRLRMMHAEQYEAAKKALVLRYDETDGYGHNKDRQWNQAVLSSGPDIRAPMNAWVWRRHG